VLDQDTGILVKYAFTCCLKCLVLGAYVFSVPCHACTSFVKEESRTRYIILAKEIVVPIELA